MSPEVWHTLGQQSHQKQLQLLRWRLEELVNTNTFLFREQGLV
jgi:hypothetical protein